MKRVYISHPMGRARVNLSDLALLHARLGAWRGQDFVLDSNALRQLSQALASDGKRDLSLWAIGAAGQLDVTRRCIPAQQAYLDYILHTVSAGRDDLEDILERPLPHNDVFRTDLAFIREIASAFCETSPSLSCCGLGTRKLLALTGLFIIGSAFFCPAFRRLLVGRL